MKNAILLVIISVVLSVSICSAAQAEKGTTAHPTQKRTYTYE